VPASDWPVPVPPWRRDEVGKAVEQFVGREVNEALGVGRGALPLPARADPGAALVAGERVADPLWGVVAGLDQGEPAPS